MIWLALVFPLYAAVLLGSWIEKQSKSAGPRNPDEVERKWTAGWDAVAGKPYLILSTNVDLCEDPEWELAKRALEAGVGVECHGRANT